MRSEQLSRWSIKTAVWYWGPVTLWLLFIALASTPAGSVAQTGRLLSLLVSALFGEMIPQRFALAHFLLREAGHFLGYSILSLLAFRAATATFPFPLLPAFRAGGAIAALSVAFTFAFACLDEWHQAGLACRTGSFADVLLDSVGGLCAAVLAGYVARRGRTLAAPS